MQQKKLKVYFTSDVHGYFYPTTYGDMDVTHKWVAADEPPHRWVEISRAQIIEF